MSDIDKGMAEFYKRVSAPPPASDKPFEIRVDVQQTPSVPFAQTEEPRQLEDPPKNVVGPPKPGLVSVTPNVVSMAGGTSVTILGSNFVSGSTVKIAGLDATSVVFVDDKHLTCITPADGLGYVNVEVTNPSGQTVSDSTLLRYTNWPDNLLISGPLFQRNDPSPVYEGYYYPYTLTLRLGNIPFVFPVGVDLYLTLVVTQSQNSGGLFVEQAPNYALFNSSTGPTANWKLRAEPHIAGNGFMEIAGSFAHGSDIGLQPVVPTFGDPLHQPAGFVIVMQEGVGPFPPTDTGPDRFVWEDLGKTGGVNAGTWGWVSGDVKTLKISCVHGDGTLNSSYNGTATISIFKYNNGGLLSASFSATVTFASGVATLGVNVSYSYSDVHNSQAFGQFNLIATAGSITGSTPNAGCLNHL
jgi:hypothetical protein